MSCFRIVNARQEAMLCNVAPAGNTQIQATLNIQQTMLHGAFIVRVTWGYLCRDFIICGVYWQFNNYKFTDLISLEPEHDEGFC